MEALKTVAPVPISFIEIDGEAKGFYQIVDKYIAVQPGMSEAQTMKTAVHETAHAVLHDRDQMEAEGVVKDQLTKKWRQKVLLMWYVIIWTGHIGVFLFLYCKLVFW